MKRTLSTFYNAELAREASTHRHRVLELLQDVGAAEDFGLTVEETIAAPPGTVGPASSILAGSLKWQSSTPRQPRGGASMRRWSPDEQGDNSPLLKRTVSDAHAAELRQQIRLDKLVITAMKRGNVSLDFINDVVNPLPVPEAIAALEAEIARHDPEHAAELETEEQHRRREKMKLLSAARRATMMVGLRKAGRRGTMAPEPNSPSSTDSGQRGRRRPTAAAKQHDPAESGLNDEERLRATLFARRQRAKEEQDRLERERREAEEREREAAAHRASLDAAAASARSDEAARDVECEPTLPEASTIEDEPERDASHRGAAPPAVTSASASRRATRPKGRGGSKRGARGGPSKPPRQHEPEPSVAPSVSLPPVENTATTVVRPRHPPQDDVPRADRGLGARWFFAQLVAPGAADVPSDPLTPAVAEGVRTAMTRQLNQYGAIGRIVFFTDDNTEFRDGYGLSQPCMPLRGYIAFDSLQPNGGGGDGGAPKDLVVTVGGWRFAVTGSAPTQRSTTPADSAAAPVAQKTPAPRSTTDANATPVNPQRPRSESKSRTTPKPAPPPHAHTHKRPPPQPPATKPPLSSQSSRPSSQASPAVRPDQGGPKPTLQQPRPHHPHRLLDDPDYIPPPLLVPESTMRRYNPPPAFGKLKSHIPLRRPGTVDHGNGSAAGGSSRHHGLGTMADSRALTSAGSDGGRPGAGASTTEKEVAGHGADMPRSFGRFAAERFTAFLPSECVEAAARHGGAAANTPPQPLPLAPATARPTSERRHADRLAVNARVSGGATSAEHHHAGASGSSSQRLSAAANPKEGGMANLLASRALTPRATTRPGWSAVASV